MPTILVVDDSAVDRQIAGACVKEAGLTPVFAGNGWEALEVIGEQHPDIVLTDLHMPELNGLDLVKRVRRDHPRLSTILMTAWGSEEIAVSALREGAASYVPKKNLRRDLPEALQIVMQSAEAARERKRVIDLFRSSESNYVLRYEPGGANALVSHLQDGLTQMDICDDGEVIRVGTALTEALNNAVDHGNLELDSKLREDSDTAYRETGNERAKQPPYRDRSVHVTAKLTPNEATFIVVDEGPGFDPSNLPNPTDPENLLLPFGRGVMLIRLFMDEVLFNESGNRITMVKRRKKKGRSDSASRE